jgi:DNA adenine methylase
VRYISPLRYPGGKGRLAPYIARLIDTQPTRPRYYAEPFAGGAAAALRLLMDEHVERIYINDLSPAIAAFWRCVFFQTEDLANKIENAEVTVDAWHEARRVYADPVGHSDLDLGFATFLLNRCNRSGILTARPIGGLDQRGYWKIDARFNREDLARRVRFLGQYRMRVSVTQKDAREFIRDIMPMDENVFVYVDPPYLVQGADLYLDSLTLQDHVDLASLLLSCRFPWLLTYDAREPVTQELYVGLRTVEFNIAHTAQVQHVGLEYAVFGPGLVVPDLNILPGACARWVAVS